MTEQHGPTATPAAARKMPGARAPRDSVFLIAQIAGPDRQPVSCRVRNISATGMMIECAAPLEPGDEVTATLRGIGDIACTVARVRGGIMGLSFPAPIDPELCRKSVLPKPKNETKDWTLHIREPFKVPRWEGTQTSRPKVR